MYPWLEGAWQQVLQQYQQQRLPHALLLEGVEGIGKADFAMAMAALLLCEQKGVLEPCGQCKGCQMFAAGNHPDFFQVGLQEKSKVIKVDQIRHLCEKLQSTAHRQGRQVAIIQPADAMNTACANALLKTLEEPSGDVVMLLLTSNRYRLLPTILSRMQRLSLTLQHHTQAVDWLNQQVTDADLVPVVLRLADGGPLKALQLVQHEGLSLRDDLFSHLGLIYQSRKNPIAGVVAMAKQDVRLLLDLFYTIVMDVVRLYMSNDTTLLVHQDEVKKLQFLQKRLPLSALLLFVDSLKQARYLFQTAASINTQLLLESLFLQWSELANNHIKRSLC